MSIWTVLSGTTSYPVRLVSHDSNAKHEGGKPHCLLRDIFRQPANARADKGHVDSAFTIDELDVTQRPSNRSAQPATTIS